MIEIRQAEDDLAVKGLLVLLAHTSGLHAAGMLGRVRFRSFWPRLARILGERTGDKSLVGRCQSSATEPSHNTFEFRIVRLSNVRPDAISSEDPL